MKSREMNDGYAQGFSAGSQPHIIRSIGSRTPTKRIARYEFHGRPAQHHAAPTCASSNPQLGLSVRPFIRNVRKNWIFTSDVVVTIRVSSGVTVFLSNQ